MKIADTIIKYIRTELTVDGPRIDLDCKLAEDGHLDSTGMLELILWVGDTFNINIQTDDFTPENFATPRHIVEFVRRRTSTAVVDIQPGAILDVVGD